MSAVIMIQGTSAAAGKTIFAAALCRLLAEAGWRAAPFCAQTIGADAVNLPQGSLSRSQYLQAEAAGVTPVVEMNPLHLQPLTENSFRLTERGVDKGEISRQDYLAAADTAFDLVLESLQTLLSRYELVVIEGAAAPVELHRPELALPNMRLAQAIKAPVLLISDIDRGGMFAYVAGTLALLPEAQRRLIQAVVVNRFRGFREKLQPGLELLEESINKPVIGVIPYLNLQPLQAADPAQREKREQVYRLLAETVRQNVDLAFIQRLLRQAGDSQDTPKEGDGKSWS
ncbi:MAG: AAA family ATPase [Dethiobacteraceae bacterium]|jgi:adenosylcobyric acid synthase|nr:AAA family ATPase [Bacillota bacterium]